MPRSRALSAELVWTALAIVVPLGVASTSGCSSSNSGPKGEGGHAVGGSGGAAGGSSGTGGVSISTLAGNGGASGSAGGTGGLGVGGGRDAGSAGSTTSHSGGATAGGGNIGLGGTGAGGSTGAGGMAGNGPTCALSQSGALDVDIPTVQISGHITVNGQPPASGLSNTYLTFNGRSAWSLSKGATYSVNLLADTYDIGVTSSDAALTSLSDQSTVLARGQALTQSGAFDIDIKTVEVSGNVTVNHATPSPDLTGTNLTFGGKSGWKLSKGAAYSVRLLGGTYDVGVSTTDSSLTSLASQSAVLVKQQAFTQSGSLDLDIESVRISGQITVNGAAPPAGLSATSITFGGATAWQMSKGATYSATLLAGTYDVGVTTSDTKLTSLSSQSNVLVRQQALDQSGALDLDIESVQVSGDVTVNHAAPPASLAGTYLTFGGAKGWSLGKGSTYSVTLLAGVYDVGVSTSDSALTSLASQSRVLLSQQSITQSGALNIDVETVQISGKVTQNHAAPATGLAGTYLTFDGSNGWLLSKGDTYSVKLLAGIYDVGVSSTDSAVTSISGQSRVLYRQQGLTQSGALDLDIETVQLSGSITVNRATPPSGLTGTYLTIGGRNVWLLSKGATYSVSLLAGRDAVGVSTTDAALTSLANGQSKTLAVCP